MVYNRARNEAKPTLAPSYQILFNNIDNLIDNERYPNRKPLRLRFLQMTGLPVDDIPCLEIWETDRLVFSSHLIDHEDHGNKLTWNPEYGDGFFNICEDIVGDFSIMCRFGGEFANKRDKTTLIFKYQNNTAFLSNHLVELQSEDVDVNPEYVDSLDAEFFKLHLVFEDSNQFDVASLLPERNFSIKQTFEEGIIEVTYKF